jgi:glutamate synthase domain-containing protein 2
MGKDCISPSAHATFHDVDSMLDWVESIAEATGLPVGIKAAVGEMGFWNDLARLMDNTGRGVDFITIDGGEGGTGAAPLAYSDHVSLPFKMGMSRIYKVFAERGITENIVFVGSGRLGFPEQCLVAFALGCDMVHVAREAMISIGCIQAQRCHTGHCPTGVATQNKWLMRGLAPQLKAPRLGGYLRALRKDVLMLCRSCGVSHPAFISSDHLDFLYGAFRSATVQDVFGYQKDWGFPGEADLAEIQSIMEAMPHPPETLRMADAAD